MLTPIQFVEELDKDNNDFFSDKDAWSQSYWAGNLCIEAVIIALRMRYWNEYRGFEVIARFMFKVDDDYLRMLVGRQVGDEAKHAQVVSKRIFELGGELGEPLPEQEAFYKMLDEFEYPEEFFAAQQFTVETQSVKRNESALERFDEKTAYMFKQHINPDEIHHVNLGKRGLLHYCNSEEAQQRAKLAAERIRYAHMAMCEANYHNLREKNLI